MIMNLIIDVKGLSICLLPASTHGRSASFFNSIPIFDIFLERLFDIFLERLSALLSSGVRFFGILTTCVFCINLIINVF